MSNDAKTKEKVRIAVFFSLCILLVVGIFVSIGSGTVSLSVSDMGSTAGRGGCGHRPHCESHPPAPHDCDSACRC